MVKVTRIVNKYHNSNSFLIDWGSKGVLVVDVGDSAPYFIQKWLTKSEKFIWAVLLTHEHGDHCAGVNVLDGLYDFPIYCTPACARNVGDSRQNFSFYAENIDTFSINRNFFSIFDDAFLEFDGLKVRMIHTPGHSPGGACYLIDEYLFTGDTILNKTRTPLGLPHSEKSAYFRSLQKLSFYIHSGMHIFPGHDEPFVFESMDSLIMDISENRASFITSWNNMVN